jgi:hypothetical protein
MPSVPGAISMKAPKSFSGDDLAVVDGADLDLFADGGDLGLGVLDLEAVGARRR